MKNKSKKKILSKKLKLIDKKIEAYRQSIEKALNQPKFKGIK